MPPRSKTGVKRDGVESHPCKERKVGEAVGRLGSCFKVSLPSREGETGRCMGKTP
jgi:hypothetical protein